MKTNFLQRTREKSDCTSKRESQELGNDKHNHNQLYRDLFKDFAQSRIANSNRIVKNQQSEKNSINSQRKAGQNHSSYELMQHLLSGSNCQQTSCMLSTQQEQEELGQLLTNRYKMQNYQLQLQKQIKEGNNKSTKHLKLLLVLLQQVSKCQIEVKYRSQGLSIGFNSKKVNKLQEQIDCLQQQNEKRKKQMQEITREYDRIVYQFNEVIQKLVHKQQKPKPYY